MPPGGFVGRDNERERLQALLAEASEGDRRLALIAGEPGIGKTRLSTHAAIEARSAGAGVLYGRCDEELALPYAPWVEALSHYVEHAPEEGLGAHVGRHGGELARLVPGLARRIPDLPAPRQADPETERYLLWGAVVGLLSSASEEGTFVLVLDDLHWADKPTLLLLKHVIAHGHEMRALILGTYRESDVGHGHPLGEALADLRREHGVERIALKGLEEPDIVDLIKRAAGHELDEAGRQLSHELFRETDGNPFYTGELLRHLLESGGVLQQPDGRWTVRAELSQLGLPPSVREVVGRRIDRLGPAVREVLATASVIGREFDVALLTAVTERDEDELIDVLEEAVAASLVVESGTVPGRFSFAHALINHTLYEELGTTRRARLHGRVAEALEEVLGEDPGGRVSELAHHWIKATTALDVSKAVAYARLAGERALSELAPDEGLRWFTQARELDAQRPDADPAEGCDVLIGLGEAQRQVGAPAFRVTLLEASRLARELQDGDRLARAVLANHRGFFSSTGDVDAERVELLEAASEALPNADPRRAHVLALLAVELTFGDAERRFAIAEEALALVGDGGAAPDGWVLQRYLFTCWVPETLEERLRRTSELLEIARRSRDPSLRLEAWVVRLYAMVESGDGAQVDRCARGLEEVVEDAPQPVLRWRAGMFRALIAHLQGELGEAEALATHAAEAGTAAGQEDAILISAGQIVSVRHDQGRLGEVIALIERSVTEYPQLTVWRGYLARSLCQLGRNDEATRLLHAEDFDALAHDFLRLATLAFWADACADLGAADRASALYTELVPWSAQCLNIGIMAWGSVSHYLGRLAATMERHDAAAEHFATAEAAHRRLGAPILLARTQHAWASSLLAAGDPREAARAEAMLTQALAGARERGCAQLEREVRSTLVSSAVS